MPQSHRTAFHSAKCNLMKTTKTHTNFLPIFALHGSECSFHLVLCRLVIDTYAILLRFLYSFGSSRVFELISFTSVAYLRC